MDRTTLFWGLLFIIVMAGCSWFSWKSSRISHSRHDSSSRSCLQTALILLKGLLFARGSRLASDSRVMVRVVEAHARYPLGITYSSDCSGCTTPYLWWSSWQLRLRLSQARCSFTNRQELFSRVASTSVAKGDHHIRATVMQAACRNGSQRGQEQSSMRALESRLLRRSSSSLTPSM